MWRHGCKISFSNKSKYNGLQGPHALANSLLRWYLNFCEGILPSLIDSFLVVDWDHHKAFIRTSFFLKDQGLLSKISLKFSFLTKLARNKFCPTSLMVTLWEQSQRWKMVDLKASLLKSLLVRNLNKMLSCDCCLDKATSWGFTAITHFSTFDKERFVSCRKKSLWFYLSKTLERQREMVLCYINIKDYMCL